MEAAGVELVSKSPRKQVVGAQIAARVDPDLSTVIAAWPDVPKEIKSAILLTMVCVSRRSSG